MQKENRRNIMQDEDKDIWSNDPVMNTEINEKIMRGYGCKDPEYMSILKDIGIEKREGELLTEDDLHWIFIYMQEGLSTGS